MSIRVLICNRLILYAEGMRRLLEEEEDIQVVGLGNDSCAARLDELAPDLVIADLTCFPCVAGPGRRILLVCDDHQSLPAYADLKELVDQGVVGILDAETDPLLLRKAVQTVHAGELWMKRQIIRNSLCAAPSPRRDIRLSRREAEILRYICEGHSNKAIADKLNISVQTVKTHCNHLFKKFGVTSRLKLAMHATTSH